jgi:hypothetical protein
MPVMLGVAEPVPGARHGRRTGSGRPSGAGCLRPIRAPAVETQQDWRAAHRCPSMADPNERRQERPRPPEHRMGDAAAPPPGPTPAAALIKRADHCAQSTKDLDQVTSSTAEDESMAAVRVPPQRLLHLQRQPAHPAPHVGAAGGEPDPHAARHRDHRRANTRSAAVRHRLAQARRRRRVPPAAQMSTSP